MDPGATDLALQVSEKPESIPRDTTLTDAVKTAWSLRCSSLGEDERKTFESYACSGLADYLEKLEAACQKHREESYGFKVIDWFEPMFKAVELFTPAAAVAIQAYPNPGSLVLGGIVGVLQTTSRLLSYQKLTVQMLAKMGRKARILLEYEKDVYKDDFPVQKGLVEVYGDIIAFCQKALRFLTENGQLRAKVKGLGLVLFRDYESQLGKEVQDFEAHIEDLEARACLCDKRRLKELRDSQEAHRKEFGQVAADTREYFQRHDAFLANLEKREQDVREQTERRTREKVKERSLDWLSPLSFRGSYDQRCDEHLEGTGSWFVKSDLYKEWKSTKESDLLWVKGRPGCGKSVLAAIAVTNLKLEVGPETAMAYAFCRREDESSQNPASIFDALVRQIGQQQPGVNSVLESEFLASQHGETPSKRTVRMVMNSALSQFKRIFLVIDALDECKDNHVLATDLLDLMQDTTLSTVKIIIFSRHDFLLEERLKPFKQIQPDLGENKEDLKSYITWLFPDDTQVSVNREIREECIAKADGMFLWVKLLWQNLQKPLHSKQKLKRIRDVPPGLASIYDLILKDICDQDEDVKSTAFLVLMWVTHARRPLHRFEMLEAVADYSEATRVDEAFKHTVPEHLVAVCANLVVIDKAGYFRLCHESVRGYLEKPASNIDRPLAEYQQQKQDANKRLAEICLTYLLLDDFECGPASSFGRLVSLVKRCPFVEYAAEFWGSHLSEETTPLLQELVSKLVLSPARRELSMQICLFDPANRSDLPIFTGSSNPLHILSIFGLRQTAETLPDIITLSQQTDESGGSPLTYALIGGHHEMSLWLIERILVAQQGLPLDATESILAIHLCASLGWADVLKKLVAAEEAFVNSKRDRDGMTPLVRACRVGEKDAALTLIDNKADVNLKDGNGDCPLIISTVNSHTSLVELLLEKGADPNCCDANGITPLHYAAESGNASIAVALLERKADPLATAAIWDDQTPLHIAAEKESVEVIKALHRASPKLDMKSRQGCTALHIAAWHNSSKSAEVLLGLGVPKDEVDDDNQTALFVAANEGALDTVKVLVAAGCAVSPAALDRKSAIYAATRSGKLSTLRCIMRRQPIEDWKALVNQRNINETPIHGAISGGNAEMVKFLLHAGADGTVNGVLESSPLHYAAHYGHRTISSLLLNHTREPNPRNQNGDTPLHFVVRERNFDFVVQFFQDCSQLGLPIEINAQNNSKKTALMVALDNGFEEGAKFLLENGAVSKPDLNGNYPIHLAAWYGFESVVQILLTHEGATSRGYCGRTPFFCAAIRAQHKILKLFSSLFDEVLNVRDDRLATPVLAALENRHLEVVNYLLDIQADYSAVDEHGNGLLHIAAAIGDLSMVQRLLNLACKGDPDRYGLTPLHKAVEANSMEVVDALINAGYHALDAPDSIGISCTHIASQQGNLEMLQKFEALGAQLGCRNLLGRSSAFAAAANGHCEILEHLKARGESLDLPDLEGTTPLIVAAWEGYPETVKYLLQDQRRAVNDCNTWERASPLSEAARAAHPLTVKHLLTAGASPYHRDSSGLNALDFAARHRVSLREMHKAGHFHDPDSLEVQRQILSDTVRNCCEALLLVPQNPSVGELYFRLSRVFNLSNALNRLQDHNTAKVCLMEISWQPKFALLNANFACEICGSKNFAGDKHVCKSCYSLTYACKQCHGEYNAAGRGAPKALEEVMNLERQVQPVRFATPEKLSLLHVANVMQYFAAGSCWMSSMLDEYDVWEQKYNSSNLYRELQRPGQEFLKMVKRMDDFVNKIYRDGHIDPEDSKSISKLSHEYEVHRRKYRADKEIFEFICKNHEFFVIPAEEQETMKSVGIDLDSEFGRLTPSFLQGIQNKYCDISGTQTEGTRYIDTDWSTKMSQGFKAASGANFFNRSAPSESKNQQGVRRPHRLERAITTYAGKPARQQTGETSVSSQIVGKPVPGLFPFPEDRRGKQSRRARTLSVSMMEGKSLLTQSFGVEMKDTRVLTALQARLGSTSDVPGLSIPSPSQPTVNKTVNVSFASESKVPGEGPVTLTSSTKEDAEASQPVFSEESMLTLALSSEPGPANESHTRESEVTKVESDETSSIPVTIGVADLETADNDANQTATRVVRTTYMMWHNENETDENMLLWLVALNVTDAMVPGFVDEYFRVKREERDEAEEDEEKRFSEDGRDERGNENDNDNEDSEK